MKDYFIGAFLGTLLIVVPVVLVTSITAHALTTQHQLERALALVESTGNVHTEYSQ